MKKKLLYFCILLVISISLRFLYAVYQTQPLLNADSYGYYGLGQKIVDNPAFSTIINQYRVPVYPALLGGLALLNNKLNTSLDVPAFRPVLDQLTFFQSALSVGGVVLIYVLLLQATVPVLWALGISLLISLNIYAYPLERAVMTDSIASSVLVGLTYLLVRLVLKPTMRDYIFFGVLSIVSWLLRPNLLLVPLLSLPLLLFVKSSAKFVRINVAIFIVSLVLPIVFASVNLRFHGYSGISQATEIALLGRILEFNLPVEAGKPYERYYNAVVDYRQKHGEPLPFRFIDAYTPLAYVDTTLMMELQRFDRAVIAANFLSYLGNVALYIPKIFADSSPLLAIDSKATDALTGFFAFIWQVYRGLWQIGYLVFILWPVSVWLYFKKPSALRMIPILLGAISISQLLIIVFFDYYEAGQYARLAMAVQPQTYVFFVFMVWLYIFRGKTHRD